MERKKDQGFCELLMLALLVSSLRPPNSALLRRRTNDHISFGTDMFGDLLIEDVYQNQFGHDIFSDRHVSNKNSFLDTFDTFSYLNSLGRFHPPIVPEVNLVAFPVSQADTLPPAAIPDLFDNEQILIDSNELNDFGLDFIQSTLLDTDDDSFQFNEFQNVSLDDSNDSFIRETNESIEQINRRFEETLGISLSDIELSENIKIDRAIEDELETDLLTSNDINDSGYTSTDNNNNNIPDDLIQSELVKEDSVDPDDVLSDISSLFDEIDFKTLEEEAFGDWMPQVTSSAFFTPENAGFYQIGDSTEGCPVYDASTQNQPTPSYSGENPFGTVLYSSLTTLSNTQTAGTHLNYPSGDDMTYLQNVTVNPGHHVQQAGSECYGCYEDNLAYHQPDAGLPVGYSANYSTYSQAHSSQYTTSVDGTLSGNYCHSHIAEDCFDKNSDSAVSSMSSERIHTISENEWNETSSNSSRYNADVTISEYSAEQSNKRNNGAQKKYHMFGKRPKSNTTETATSYQNNNVEPNYMVDYEQQAQQQTAPYYPYVNPDVNACPETSLQYYQHCVSQNHSYAIAPQPQIVIPPSNVEPQQTIINPEETIKPPKRKKSTYSKADSLESHFNRDERRAQLLNIPIPTEDIVNLPIDEFNDRLSKHDLTDLQLSTIRDIRRRGKNKVAAQNCRKRKLDQINCLQSEVVNIVEHKSDLLKKINHYSQMIAVTKTQYEQLYKFLFETSPESDLRCLPSTSKNSNEHFEMNDESTSSDTSFNSFSKQQN